MAQLSISESDLRQLVASLDASLELFRRNRDRLSVADVRIQSLISAVRLEVMERLNRESVEPPRAGR